jgi:acetyl-CoA carboxylase biotin carboxyl carrier protein
MDIRKIKKLIELVEESGISELEISEGEESVRISRAAPAASYPVMQQAYAAPMMQPQAPAAAAAAAQAEAPAKAKSVVTSYVPRWLVLSTAPRARTRKRSWKSVRKLTWATPCASLKR